MSFLHHNALDETVITYLLKGQDKGRRKVGVRWTSVGRRPGEGYRDLVEGITGQMEEGLEEKGRLAEGNRGLLEGIPGKVEGSL